MNQPTKFTVVGAGNGGRAMAAHLALMGKESISAEVSNWKVIRMDQVDLVRSKKPPQI